VIKEEDDEAFGSSSNGENSDKPIVKKKTKKNELDSDSGSGSSSSEVTNSEQSETSEKSEPVKKAKTMPKKQMSGISYSKSPT